MPRGLLREAPSFLHFSPLPLFSPIPAIAAAQIRRKQYRHASCISDISFEKARSVMAG
ncbi:hypothetical protein D3C73_271850 [compost metagenome]